LFSRYAPAIDVRSRYCGADVIETLDRIVQGRVSKDHPRLDNGPEFISKEFGLWAFLRGVTLDFSRQGKLTDNAYIESLNGKFRAECQNANWFMSLDEGRRKCEASCGHIGRSDRKCRRGCICHLVHMASQCRMKPESTSRGGPRLGQAQFF
jgi:hypothetical protein